MTDMTDLDKAAVAGICAELYEAAKDIAEYASYAEIVGGVSVNRTQIRRCCDAVFELTHKYRAMLASAEGEK